MPHRRAHFVARCEDGAALSPMPPLTRDEPLGDGAVFDPGDGAELVPP